MVTITPPITEAFMRVIIAKKVNILLTLRFYNGIIMRPEKK
jgi:hypothetical protein